MNESDSTIRSRELGEGLRRALAEARLSNRDVSRKLGWSDSKVSRLLTGKRNGTAVDVSALLALCGVTGAERDHLLGLCEDSGKPGWLQQFGDRLPEQLRTLIDHENKATRITEFQPLIVPGLLQTEDYAQASLRGLGTLPEDSIDNRVAARMARKSLFGRHRQATFEYFIHEFVFHLRVGNDAVMSGQLHELIRLSVRPYINLRVVPVSAGVYAGVAGAYMLMEFADFRPLTYLDSETASLFLEEPVEINTYRTVLRALAEKALSEGQSRELIANLATGLYPQMEDEQ